LAVTVQAVVTRSQVEAAAGPHGLWFPVDPGADETLGGMAATNASGTTTVRYGGMRAHVLALEVVLADGRVVRTGSRAVKTSAGYNLTELFIGSEGTLGVITELTVRLHPIPERIVVARAAFPSVEAACRAAAAIGHARDALDASDLRGGIVGHVGDGNFHVAFLLDPTDKESVARAEALNAAVVEDALARGGTCTGEHGIGHGKLAYLAREHGDLVPLYRGIKDLLDPNGILNPGKVVPL